MGSSKTLSLLLFGLNDAFACSFRHFLVNLSAFGGT